MAPDGSLVFKMAFIGMTHDEEPILIGKLDRRSGLYVLGKPGMGKSNLLLNIAPADIVTGANVIFLDPHANGITYLFDHLYYKEIKHRLEKDNEQNPIVIVDPENEKYSLGINPLACNNLDSLNARTNTQTRTYCIFYKLWELEWGPQLQLIIQTTLYVFIENQEYTLAEVPLFLTNAAFRNHLVGNVKDSTDVRDLWQYEFGIKRERDQQDHVQAALTRVRTFLNHPYIMDIVGQRKTSIDFPPLWILLVKFSANLAPD